MIPLHQGQPDAGALELRSPVQPLERPEELAGILHVEAGPVVPDEVRGKFRTGHVAADLDGRPLLPHG